MTEHHFTCTRGEEIANATSHFIGLIAALVATPALFHAAVVRGAAFVIGVTVFIASILLLYLGSAVYHAWPRNRIKHLLRVIDHSAIFLLIAGTYTPFALGPLRGSAGWTVLLIVWAVAIVGVWLKIRHGAMYLPRVSIALYLGMGWLALFFARPFVMVVPIATTLWVIAGGIVYTAGILFFVRDHRRYSHFVWHLFVLAGTCCHFCAVLSYAQTNS